MDRITFHHPDIIRLSQKEFILVKVDLTASESSYYAQLLERFAVKGVPTIVFIDHTGQKRRDLRQVDYVAPKDFLNQMVELQ